MAKKPPSSGPDGSDVPCFGPEQRMLLETVAAPLYAEAVSQAGIKLDDPRLRRTAPERPAIDLMIELGLLIEDDGSGLLVAKDPAGSQAAVVTPLGQRGAELLNESSRWAQVFGELSQTWRSSPIAAHGPFTELHGKTAIGQFLLDATDDAKVDILTAQPQANRALGQLAEVADTEANALARGVAIRTLYQHSARRSSATHQYVRAVVQAGAEVRTLDEFFHRLMIFDRTLAVIPGETGTESAVVIREPSVVAYLVDVFERAWDRARPFGNSESDTMRDIASEQRAMTIRLLIQGHADPASAKRLGVSARTYAGYIADLKAEYEAETRFQLGYVMGQRGITGEDSSNSQ